MKYFSKTIGTGLVLVALQFCLQVWDVYTGQGQAVSLLFLLIALPVLLRGVGRLRRGDPEGGVIGAGASAFFEPLGLVCLVGCLLFRDRLLREAYLAGADAASGPEQESVTAGAADRSPAGGEENAERRQKTSREWSGRDLWGLLAVTLLLLGIFAGLQYKMSGWGYETARQLLPLLFGFFLSVAGVRLLLRGSPVGGMLGIVGSAFLVPLGLFCLVGCLRLRDKLLRRNWAAEAAAPSADGESSGG